MSFKPSKPQPDFGTLRTSLANSGIAVKQNALYQTIYGLISRTQDARDILVGNVVDINNSINDIDTLINSITTILNTFENATYLTSSDESVDLPNSRQLLAGTGVTFDDTVVNQRTINASGIDREWSVLTNGVVATPELIFASGDVIMISVP